MKYLMYGLFFYLGGAVASSWLWIFHPWQPILWPIQIADFWITILQ